MKENDKIKHEDKMTQNNVKINSKTMTAQQKGPSDWLCFYHVCSIVILQNDLYTVKYKEILNGIFYFFLCCLIYEDGFLSKLTCVNFVISLD